MFLLLLILTSNESRKVAGRQRLFEHSQAIVVFIRLMLESKDIFANSSANCGLSTSLLCETFEHRGE